jgi:hypothetical protein
MRVTSCKQGAAHRYDAVREHHGDFNTMYISELVVVFSGQWNYCQNTTTTGQLIKTVLSGIFISRGQYCAQHGSKRVEKHWY